VKFILDECVPRRAAVWLRSKGHDAATMQELKKIGLVNGKVAQHVIDSNAALVTCDSDFLSLKKNVLLTLRFIFIKVHPRTAKSVIALLEKYLQDALELLQTTKNVTITTSGCTT
jgi:predicted nuclease of predicted toxin-antitoxin system